MQYLKPIQTSNFCFHTGPIFVWANESTQITTPFYPANYTNNVSAVWFLETLANRRIFITFVAFDTERPYDFLEAGDGLNSSDHSSTFFRWSGSHKPPELLSNGNTLWLKFTSDGSVTSSGFSLLASSVPFNGKQIFD